MVESTSFLTDNVNARSICGGIDGDGIEEIRWSTGGQISVYKCTGLHEYERVWTWYQTGNNSCNLNLYDMNGNGYNELLKSGSGMTHIIEIEAIRVRYPNNAGLQCRGGDTCPIRGETFFPPRCDSISLFLRTDTIWSLVDTIAHGLASSETSYRWVVPDIRVDSWRIIAIAYGPGWRRDEADNIFRTLPLGVSEAAQPLIRETKLLSISPNPTTGIARINYQLRDATPVTLRLADAGGHIIRHELIPSHKSGYYEHIYNISQLSLSSYFLTFSTNSQHETMKIVYK